MENEFTYCEVCNTLCVGCKQVKKNGEVFAVCKSCRFIYLQPEFTNRA